MKFFLLVLICACSEIKPPPMDRAAWIDFCQTDVNGDGNLWTRSECEEEAEHIAEFQCTTDLDCQTKNPEKEKF